MCNVLAFGWILSVLCPCISVSLSAWCMQKTQRIRTGVSHRGCAKNPKNKDWCVTHRGCAKNPKNKDWYVTHRGCASQMGAWLIKKRNQANQHSANAKPQAMIED